MKKKKFKSLWSGSLIKFIEIFLDIFTIVLSATTCSLISHYLLDGSFPNVFYIYMNNIPDTLSYMAYFIILLVLFVIYKTSVVNKTFLSVMKSIILTLIMSNIILIFYLFITKSDFLFSPMDVVLLLVIQIMFFSFYKYFFHKLLVKFNQRSVIIIGPKTEAIKLAEAFHKDKEHFKKLKFVFFLDENFDIKALFEIINCIDDVYLTSGIIENIRKDIILYTVAKRTKDIFLVPKSHELGFVRAKDDNLDDILILHIPTMHLTLEQRFLKRSFDILVSLSLLIVSFPIMIFAIILIKLQGDGPVLFKQERFKRENKPFYIYKFRTMKVTQSLSENKDLATNNDPRITVIGKFLRASRIDELPQLFNIIKGDMSLVGPRPFMRSVIDKAVAENPEFPFRGNVKPGVTGLAQVKGKYDTPEREKLRYDLLYVRKYSFWYDIKIIVLTIKAVFTKISNSEESKNDDFERYMLEKDNIYKKTGFGYEIIK